MSSLIFVHLFHILIVGTIFLYVGIKQTNIPILFYPFLIFLGVVIILYHIYKAYIKITKGQSAWINYIHIFLVGPLLIYIGINKKNTKPRFFEMLLMLGFAAIGYHGYYLFTELYSSKLTK